MKKRKVASPTQFLLVKEMRTFFAEVLFASFCIFSSLADYFAIVIFFAQLKINAFNCKLFDAKGIRKKGIFFVARPLRPSVLALPPPLSGFLVELVGEDGAC